MSVKCIQQITPRNLFLDLLCFHDKLHVTSRRIITMQYCAVSVTNIIPVWRVSVRRLPMFELVRCRDGPQYTVLISYLEIRVWSKTPRFFVILYCAYSRSTGSV